MLEVMVRRGPTAALSVSALFLSLAAPAWAGGDEPSSTDVNAARELGKEGMKLADQGKCDQAIDKLARAEKLFHAPTILTRLGECQVKTGKLVAGTESLQRVVHEPLPDKAPPQFVKARDKAQKILNEVQGKIAKLKINVNAPPKTEVAIKIDGEVVSSALIGADRPTDPGEHFIEATAQGFLKSSETVVLKEGGSGEVTLNMKIDPDAPPPPPPDDHPKDVNNPPPVDRPHEGGSGLRTAGFVVLGVGGVGVVLGAIFGLVTIGQKSDIEKMCTAGKDMCTPGTQSKIDGANAMGWVSTIGFVAGGIAVAAGATMILIGGGSSAKKTTGTGITPWIGPTGAGVSGTF